MPADSAKTRSRILDAAERQFSQKGFAAASMSEIARVSKVSKALLHHHFGSKDGLWSAVKERRFGEFWEAQSKLFKVLAPGAPMAEQSVKTYFQFLQQNPSFVRLMTWHFLEHEQLDDLADAVGGPEAAAGVEMMRACQATGEVRSDVDPRHATILFFCLVVHWHQAKHLYLRWMGQPKDQSPAAADKAYLKDLLKVFLRGISPER